MFLYNEKSVESYLARKEFCKMSIYIKDHHLILNRPICHPKPMSTKGMTKAPITVKNMVHNLLLKLRT